MPITIEKNSGSLEECLQVFKLDQDKVCQLMA